MTFRIRALGPLILLSIACYHLTLIPALGRTAATGPEIFAMLVWVSQIICLIFGVAATADAVSEEKRNGTLGLLFLTRLRGFDVILGKLSTSGIVSGSVIIASAPILAMTVLLGGVTLWEVARVLLALGTTLLLALSTGLFFSALCRSHASSIALILSAFCVMELGPTLALQLGAPSLGMASATRLMSAALDAPAFVGEFQRSVLTMVFIAMVLLGSASWLLPRVWREKAPHRRAHAGQRFALLMSRGPERLRGAFRQKALLKSPISWLAGRNPITTIALAVILTLVVISASVATRFDWGIPINPAAKAFLPYILTGLLCAGIATLSHLYLLAQLAIHSCRWIIESREGGVLELIAAGRLRRGQIISGHWRNLGRRGGPTLLAIVITTALALLWFCDIYYFESGERLRLLNFISDSFTALTRGTNEPQHFLGICFIVACFFLPVAWIALGSVGPYLALRLPKPKNVPFITLLCVLAPPFVLIMPLIGVRDYLAVCHQIKAPAGYERALWSLITLAPYLGMIGFTQFQVWRNFHELAFHNVRTGEKMITEPPAQISRTFSNFVKLRACPRVTRTRSFNRTPPSSG